jgi:hypothetical protein
MYEFEPTLLYRTCTSVSEAMATARSVAQQHSVTVIACGCEVRLVQVPYDSPSYKYFREAWRTGQLQQGLVTQADLYIEDAPTEAHEFVRAKEREYTMRPEEYYREALLDLSKNDPPVPPRDE